MGAHHGWRAEGKRNRVSAYTALGHKAGDNLGAALKGSHKSVIYWEGGGSGGSFGTLGPGAKLIVNTNNQSTRPIQWLAPAKPGCSFGGRPAEGRRWRVVGWGRSMGWRMVWDRGGGRDLGSWGGGRIGNLGHGEIGAGHTRTLRRAMLNPTVVLT